jgi:outer membrane murein-binding lipoprotein Lpp
MLVTIAQKIKRINLMIHQIRSDYNQTTDLKAAADHLNAAERRLEAHAHKTFTPEALADVYEDIFLED